MTRPDGRPCALVRGAGDLATGVALALFHAGFRVVMTELAEPTAIRRTAAFAESVFDGEQTVEGVTARRVEPGALEAECEAGRIAVVVDPGSQVRAALRPVLVVDAILAKRNLGTDRGFAPIVIGLGPGFVAGRDVDAVVETMRGHDLGRIILSGQAASDTGMPGDIGGRTGERILRAPRAGIVEHARKIGDLVQDGEIVARIAEAAVRARFSGCLRGLIHQGVTVSAGMKIGDVDPRGEVRYCYSLSDKARAVGRAALEAALQIGRERGLLSLTGPGSGAGRGADTGPG